MEPFLLFYALDPAGTFGLARADDEIVLRRWTGAGWQDVPLAEEGADAAGGPIWAATVRGVTGFQFQPERGIDVPDLSGWTVPQASAPLLDRAFAGPFDFDDGNTRHAFSRLIQTCGATGSFVRITRKKKSDAAGWVHFRFAFRVPVLGDMAGASRNLVAGDARIDGRFDPDLLLAVASCGVNSDHSRIASVIREERAARAEQEQPAIRRMPYLAGGLAFPDPHLESLAINAAASAMIDGLAARIAPGDGPQRAPKEWWPSKPDRWGSATQLADGFWWALEPTINGPDPTRKLTLARAISALGDFPLSPDQLDQQGQAVGRPVLAALTPVSPRAADTDPLAPMLGLLEELGLDVAEVAARAPMACGRAAARSPIIISTPASPMTSRAMAGWNGGAGSACDARRAAAPRRPCCACGRGVGRMASPFNSIRPAMCKAIPSGSRG